MVLVASVRCSLRPGADGRWSTAVEDTSVPLLERRGRRRRRCPDGLPSDAHAHFSDVRNSRRARAVRGVRDRFADRRVRGPGRRPRGGRRSRTRGPGGWASRGARPRARRRWSRPGRGARSGRSGWARPGGRCRWRTPRTGSGSPAPARPAPGPRGCPGVSSRASGSSGTRGASRASSVPPCGVPRVTRVCTAASPPWRWTKQRASSPPRLCPTTCTRSCPVAAASQVTVAPSGRGGLRDVGGEQAVVVGGDRREAALRRTGRAGRRWSGCRRCRAPAGSAWSAAPRSCAEQPRWPGPRRCPAGGGSGRPSRAARRAGRSRRCAALQAASRATPGSARAARGPARQALPAPPSGTARRC